MKKVVLKKVDLVKFNNFIDSLIPLSESGTIYFKINQSSILTDSHNDSATVIKSMRMGIDELCEESNVAELPSQVKLCFYDGGKVKKAFSFLSGNEIKCEITFSELETENGMELFAETMKVSSPKISITLDAADPSLFEFANVPEEVIEQVKETSEADCSFRMSENEVLQVQKFMDFDSNDEVEFIVNGEVKVCSEDAYEIAIADDFEGLEGGGVNRYKIDKKLFKLVDVRPYMVYPLLDASKIIFKTDDKSMEVVITLHEDADI